MVVSGTVCRKLYNLLVSGLQLAHQEWNCSTASFFLFLFFGTQFHFAPVVTWFSVLELYCVWNAYEPFLFGCTQSCYCKCSDCKHMLVCALLQPNIVYIPFRILSYNEDIAKKLCFVSLQLRGFNVTCKSCHFFFLVTSVAWWMWALL